MGFMDSLEDVLLKRKAVTENGALGYATTGKALVDLNFAVSSLRNESEEEIIKRFVKAYYEDKVLAVKWLFFLRDIRGGLGERRSFRIIFSYLAASAQQMAERLVPLVAEYGRFDDLLCLLDTPLEENVLAFIKKQLDTDTEAMLSVLKFIEEHLETDREAVIVKKLQNTLASLQRNTARCLQG